jgi:FkbM family methyltransferase
MQGVFIRRGIAWKLDLNEGIDFSIYLLGAFELQLLRYYSAKIALGAIVLDIGANIGAHTLPLAELVGPNGTIIAIEATEYALTKLNCNLALNPALRDRVIVSHSLLVCNEIAPPPEEITSSWPLEAGKANDTLLVGGSVKQLGNAQIITLDRLIDSLGLKTVDWIKIDVDGNETSVLEGALGCLAKFRPRILIEFSPYCHKGDSFGRLLKILTDVGYHFYLIPSRKRLPNTEAQLTSYIPKRGSINVLAEA